jgi:multiple antibiotic resistance protein
MCPLFCAERIVTDAVTFFVVVNPIGLVPLFISTTRHELPSARRRIAGRSVIIAALILIVFIAVGEILLSAMGITLPSFRIAGGLVLLAIAMKMILGDEPKDEPADGGDGPAEHSQDVAVFPLAMPFIAGPATIMAAVLLTDSDRFSFPQQAVTTTVLLIILAFTYGMMLAAETVHRVIGTTGANVLNRVMGLILAALAVQSALDGVRTAFSLR